MAAQVVEEMVEDEIYYRQWVAGLSQQANIQLIYTRNMKERMFQKLGGEHVHVNPSTAKRTKTMVAGDMISEVHVMGAWVCVCGRHERGIA